MKSGIMFVECLQLTQDNFRICENLALQVCEILMLEKHLSDKKFGNIYYFLLISNSLTLRNLNHNRKYYLTSKVNEFWYFIIFSQIYMETNVVIKMCRDLVHHF